jgi:hypothetical protein
VREVSSRVGAGNGYDIDVHHPSSSRWRGGGEDDGKERKDDWLIIKCDPPSFDFARTMPISILCIIMSAKEAHNCNCFRIMFVFVFIIIIIIIIVEPSYS